MTPSSNRLEQELARIAATIQAQVGVCAHHLGLGVQIGLRADQRFPLASTAKVPMALAVLRQVEQGLLDLTQLVAVEERDISPGSGLLKDNFVHPGVQLSLQNLIELALRNSDNTASDILLRLSGGVEAVNQFLHTLAITDLALHRPFKALLADLYGVTLPANTPWSLAAYRQAFHAVPASEQRAAVQRFLQNSRDTGSPRALVTLLAALPQGQALNPHHTALVRTAMRNAQGSPNRIKGLLPPGIVVAHKGGTLADCVVNDAGLIEMPDGGGTVALAILVQGTKLNIPATERVIAHIARSMYDYFRFADG
jgi:beta-lactamase class A